MAEYVAIYDPDVELGAIVDVETMRGMGPVGGGPNAKAELTAFIDTMPAAIWKLSSANLVDAWMQFWAGNFAELYADPSEGYETPVEQGSTNGDNASALAELEASAGASEPPPVQPADSDMEADASETDAVVQPAYDDMERYDTDEDVPAPYTGVCFACDGKGTVPGATEGANVTCNLCHGSGRLPAQVEA